MDTHIYLAVERLEALLLSLREQVAELREQMEANEKLEPEPPARRK